MPEKKGVQALPYPRLLVVLAVALLVGLVFVAIDLSPSLRHVEVALLSGPEQGNYRRLAEQVREHGADHGAALSVATTAGSVDNLERLSAAAESCEVHFALTQDGIAPPEGSALELIARLPRSESLFLLGKGAAQLTSFSQLRSFTIGAGPAKSGTDRLMRQIFGDEDLAPLGITLQNHALDDQLRLLESGELALGGFVVDEDAALVRDAIRDRGLELADLAHLDVIARKHDHLWHGRIGAGQYDPLRLLPPQDRRVLRVDTLVVGNGCASHAQTVGMLTLLVDTFPGLVEHNRQKGTSSFFATSSTASHFFVQGGPELAERHVPWLVDIMPPSNWVYVVMTISLLFNAMGFGHRFRLWRLDADRVAADQKVQDLLGPELTYEDIHDLAPSEEHREAEVLTGVEACLATHGELLDRCRRHSVSMLVPMGQEMAYRYQEDQIEQALVALRRFRSRLAAALPLQEEETSEVQA